MVKRPKSPEPVEDSKFLTVVHPFPLNANMEVPNDFKEFMFWLASVVGKDYALGVYHKPSARGMVVAEVSKMFQDSENLLGEHSWSKFLYKCSSEEKERKTRVYYSTYSNARALQKDGWKNILADDEHFAEFAPINRKIRNPYPIPVWCDVPYEDPTNKRICRPIPVETKAPPPRASVPVPGSSTWISQKTGRKAPLQPPFVEQKGGPSKKGGSTTSNAKGGAKASVNPDAWKTPITSPPMSKSPSTASAVSPSSAISTQSAWSKPFSVQTTSTIASTPRSVSPASATAGTDFSVPISTPSSISSAYSSPPGLGPPSNSPLSPPGKPANPRGSSSITMLRTQFAEASISGADASSSIMASPSEGSYGFDDDDSEDDFAFPNASEVLPRSEVMSFASAEEPRVGKGPGKGKFSAGNIVRNQRNDTSDDVTKVPQRANRTFRKVIEEDELCPLHGVVCSKGICSVMKKKKRQKEWAEKKAEKERLRNKRRQSEENGGSLPVEDEEDGGEDGDEDDTKTEVGGEGGGGGTASVVETSRAASVASSSKKTTTRASTVSVRKGYWGPRKERKAKARSPGSNNSDEEGNETDRLETVTASSARPTYGGPSTANSVLLSDGNDSDSNDDLPPMSTFDSAATISPYTSPSPPPSHNSNGSSRATTVKPTPTRHHSAWSKTASAASASVSLPSDSSSSGFKSPVSPAWGPPPGLSRAPPALGPPSSVGDASSTAATVASSTRKSYVSSGSSAWNKVSERTQAKGNDVKGKTATGAASANGVNKPQAGGDVKGKGKAPTTGKGKEKGDAKSRMWDDMVDDDDGDLGSVMEF